MAGFTELHSFGDASESSNGVCVYLLCEHPEGIHCNLIASKTRVTPLSKQTIPRLELLSSLLASQLTESVNKALEDVKKIDSVAYWSDSTVVLCWIRNPKKEFKQFVENRLIEIRKIALPDYGSTFQKNRTKRMSHLVEQQLRDNKLWWNGPEFLTKTTKHWPPETRNEQEDNSELKSPLTSVTTSANNITQIPSIVRLIDASNYSSIVRLHRVTAYVIRFVENLKERVGKLDITVGPITCEEIDNAELKWIKDIRYPMAKQTKFEKV